MLTDDRLLEIQIETLFRVRGDGRLLDVNETDGPPAPRFFLGRTLAGNVARYRHDLSDDLVASLDRLVSAEPVAPALTGEPPPGLDAMRTVLRAAADISHEWRGPAYRFPDPLPTAAVPTVAVRAENAAVLRGPFALMAEWLDEIQPCLAVVIEGAAVALCHAARRSPLAAEAGVETLPDHRAKGYGAAVVAAWAGAVRREGLLPLYSTSWDNAASRALAARLGLVLYGDDVHLG